MDQTHYLKYPDWSIGPRTQYRGCYLVTVSISTRGQYYLLPYKKVITNIPLTITMLEKCPIPQSQVVLFSDTHHLPRLLHTPTF